MHNRKKPDSHRQQRHRNPHTSRRSTDSQSIRQARCPRLPRVCVSPSTVEVRGARAPEGRSPLKLGHTSEPAQKNQ